MRTKFSGSPQELVIFQGNRYRVKSHFVATAANTLLRRLSTRFCSVCVGGGICAHSAKRAFVRSGTDVGPGFRSVP